MSQAKLSRPEQADIRVAIIEDERDTRECLSLLVNGTDGYVCSGSYRTMEEALEKIPRQPARRRAFGIGLPGISGIEGVRDLKQRYPDLMVLMLTVYDDDDRIFDALCAGACGYLLKKTPPARLLESLKEAVAGGAPMSPEVARRVIALFRESTRPRAPTTSHASRDTVAQAVRRRPQLQDRRGELGYPSTP